MNCKIIHEREGMVLIEWQSASGLARALVTHNMLQTREGRAATVIAPERGIPYGVPWEYVLPDMQATRGRLADELRRRGIWTVEDLRAHPQEIMGALTSVYGVDLAAILNAAKDYTRMESVR